MSEGQTSGVKDSLSQELSSNNKTWTSMAGAFSSTFMNSGSQIPMLNGDNFSDWKDQVLLTLGCMDLDLAFRVDEPPIPTDSSTPTEKTSYEA
ncbi:UNVERIFIED_CONTAM: hypothetical protein Slati_3636900 [Sesamum latifolium]|uniref:Retrotransposon Copia-like N-terminal domain-containing protein n=1 Tax=Sesamum latifolium TaxID=2727402 RepID=A0AAW2U100_9LAMI